MADQECQYDLSNSVEYRDCFLPTITKENYKELCIVLNSTKCQQFYNDPMFYLPNCIDDYQISELLSPTIISSTLSSIHLICQTDEQNNLCPIAEALLNNQNLKEKTIKKTCASKNCINAAIQVYSSLQTNLNDFENLSITTGSNDDSSKNNIVTVMDYLNSQECQNYKSNKGDSNESSSTNLKISYSIFISLGILLFFIY
ncbi:hypothetical protein BCR36DRAFT_580034 [Piromyces finnis]|uniref:Uncharacterized protein n=1 Tax=Piromyces finnis TaxID=1754191 RepID=A0A1Y1VKX3_9FUNG|nr:hypothetical protein BCR36DRAFT_580034 [Piromyces finnis]|eukprot:ORX58408.1 hypothetical protein BCR36DRAFT_580034 [Piromyces finnis]